jgi:aromatic ring-opening dioxygenase catalytic subunit (LigB family)
MAKQWEKMTKNQKLDMLRAEVAKIVTAVGKLTHRLDDIERSKSKKMKPKTKRVSKKAVPPALSTASTSPALTPEAPASATATTDASSTAQ